MTNQNINITENFKDCMTKKYWKFSGRASRQEFWKFVLMAFCLNLVFSGLDFSCRGTSLGTIVSLVSSLFNLALILPNLAVSVRRLHDVNKRGWFLLLPFLAFPIFLLSIIFPSFATGGLFVFGGIYLVASTIYLCYLEVKKGDVGPNRFGEDPYAEEEISD